MGQEEKGRFLWYELMTTDPEAAGQFYPAVVGWELQRWQEVPEGQPPYWMFSAGGAPVAGLMELPGDAAGAPPNWMGYIGTDDVDATTERARELGASVHVGPRDIPSTGRFSVVSDPQGAIIAFYRSANPMEAPDQPPVGHVSWHELATSDHEAGWDFYSELFGWERTSNFDMGDGWMYEMFSLPGREGDAGAMFTKSDDMPGPPAWTYYFSVEDIERAAGAVEEGGGKVLNGPMEVPGGDRVAVCADPQGAVFALHARGS
ncbi:MAG: VOC family protein [Gemmatimonadota bacterium]